MLKITHLHKTFFPNTPNEKKALRGVSLTLEEGLCHSHRFQRFRQVHSNELHCRRLLS